jgi:hypothetical protein
VIGIDPRDLLVRIGGLGQRATRVEEAGQLEAQLRMRGIARERGFERRLRLVGRADGGLEMRLEACVFGLGRRHPRRATRGIERFEQATLRRQRQREVVPGRRMVRIGGDGATRRRFRLLRAAERDLRGGEVAQDLR